MNNLKNRFKKMYTSYTLGPVERGYNPFRSLDKEFIDKIFHAWCDLTEGVGDE